MKLEKKMVIRISKEERETLRNIVNIVEEAFDVVDGCETLIDVILGIVGGDNIIYTSMGESVEVEYDK